MKEIWKDVVGYEGLYEASNMGRVKSKNRIQSLKSGLRNKKGIELSPATDSHGYMTVKLYKDGKAKTHGIHVVLAITFLGHTPSGVTMSVDHIDNDRKNNFLSNIQVISQRKNLSKDKKNKTSKYTGVHIGGHKKDRWKSTIQYNGKKIHLGYFRCETLAHFEYLKKLKEIEETDYRVKLARVDKVTGKVLKILN